MRRRSQNSFDAASYFAGMYELGDRRDYLTLHGGDVVDKIIGADGMDKSKVFKVRKMDGIPNTVMVVRKRFLRALLRCTTYTQTFNYLIQKLSGNDVREFFYGIWLGNHNYLARKAESRRVCRCRGQKNWVRRV